MQFLWCRGVFELFRIMARTVRCCDGELQGLSGIAETPRQSVVGGTTPWHATTTTAVMMYFNQIVKRPHL